MDYFDKYLKYKKKYLKLKNSHKLKQFGGSNFNLGLRKDIYELFPNIRNEDLDIKKIVEDNLNTIDFRIIMNRIEEDIDIVENKIYKSMKGYSSNKKNILDKIVDSTMELYDIIFKANERMKIEDPPRELIVVVPGDSGIKQSKVVEWVLDINDVKQYNGKKIKFVYFPISKLGKFKDVDGILQPYLKQKLDINENIHKLYLIVDSIDTGDSVENLRNYILKDFEGKKRNERPYVSYQETIPWIDVLINAKGTQRCTPEYYPHVEGLFGPYKIVDFSFCNTIIMAIYYFYLIRHPELVDKIRSSAGVSVGSSAGVSVGSSAGVSVGSSAEKY